MTTVALSPRANLSWLLAIGIASWMGTVVGRAQGTVYSDRSLFNAVLLSSTTIDFAAMPDPVGGTGRSPITVSGVTFTNNEARLFTGDGYLWNFDSSYPVGIFLPSVPFPPNSGNAFGADFSGGIVQNNPFNATLTFTLGNGQTYTHSFAGQMGAWTFLGFVFSQPIRNVVYDDGGSFLPGAHEEKLDNVTFGRAVIVPEPQVLSISAGAVILWLAVRRRRC